ncbi:MAG: hypothetical protein H0W64_04825 [Gammaproteobacteria bacterium]|nr:hypothetical protein [Gammaproteobacteria bacterium]
MSYTRNLSKEKSAFCREVENRRYEIIHSYLTGTCPGGREVEKLFTYLLDESQLHMYINKSLDDINSNAKKKYKSKELERIYAKTTHNLNNLLNEWKHSETNDMRLKLGSHPFYQFQNNRNHFMSFHNYQPDIAYKYQSVLYNPSTTNFFTGPVTVIRHHKK